MLSTPECARGCSTRSASTRSSSFPTFALGHFSRSDDPDVRYGGTQALNRAMVAFCATDPRLLAVGYLPLNDPGRAFEALDDALAVGVAAVWVSSDAPGDFSPTHVDLEPVWARLAEAGVPFVLHVGGGKLLPKEFHKNGRPRPSTGSVAARTCGPRTSRCCTTRPSASLPAWFSTASSNVTRSCEAQRSSSARAGSRDAPQPRPRAPIVLEVRAALQELSSSRRSTSAARCASRRSRSRTPPGCIEQCGPELFMFSTDYPHPEGGRRPFEAFGEARGGVRRVDPRPVLLAERGRAPRPRLSAASTR